MTESFLATDEIRIFESSGGIPASDSNDRDFLATDETQITQIFLTRSHEVPEGHHFINRRFQPTGSTSPFAGKSRRDDT